MYKKKELPVPSLPTRKQRSPLRVAVRCALAHPRPALSISAGLIVLGLATHGTPAFAAAFPAEINLSSLQTANGGDGSAGFILKGIDLSDASGWSVSGAGDVNGDGIDDLLVGAPFADPGGREFAFETAGETYVVFGRDQTAFPAEIELSSLAAGDGSLGFVLNGGITDYSGRSVSAAGDVNGDGIDDLLVGAYKTTPELGVREWVGRSYVIFGRAETAFPAEFELSSLSAVNGGDGSSGFVLAGIDHEDRMGRSVSGAGDVNGDGVDDLIVGARYGDPGNRDFAGESYVLFGRAQQSFPAEIEMSSLLAVNGGDGSAGFVLNGINPGDRSGFSVSAAGDVNGDGIDDLVVGADRADSGGRDNTGQTYVVFGRNQSTFPAEFELSSLLAVNGGDGSLGFVVNGISTFSLSGYSVDGAGDVNGDGVDDLIIGAILAFGDPDQDINTGQSYIVFGRNQTAFPAELELSSLQPANGGDGSAGVVLNGIESDDEMGSSVSGAGDVNRDGIDDLIIGAPYAWPEGNRVNAGESYVVFGRRQAFPAQLEMSSLQTANGGDGSAGFLLKGTDSSDRSGVSVSAAGDINGDGVDDLLVGAGSAGETYVVFGRVTMCGGSEITIFGSAADDSISGTAGPDVIHGLGGNDTIQGLGSNDLICGGDGNDTVYGNAGNDVILGEDGDDDLFGGPGSDDMDGGPGNDRLFGGDSRDVMHGGIGDDRLFGKDGNDQLWGDQGHDSLFGEGGDDWMFGGPGADRLFGDSGSDHLFGERDNDDLDGGADEDSCDGGSPQNGDTATNCEQTSQVP